MPCLTKKHRETCLRWAKTYMKQDFSKVMFTDECRATLDVPDEWSSVWILQGHAAQDRFRRQQGGGGVMFWALVED